MRIGILTWYFAMNHGARAHTYALLHTLRNMGYDVEIIAYRSWKSYVEVEPYWFVSRNIPVMMRRLKYRLYFSRTEKDYGFLSKPVHSAKEIDALGYDLVILGSDEIFNINHLITSKDYTYFGVGIKKTPKIAYAVSCGQSAVDIKWPKEVIEAVRDIKTIAVRDRNSKEIIENNTGRKAEIVLDPTLLYDFKELQDPDWNHWNYILIYTFGGVDDYKDEILTYAKESGLKIVCIGNRFNWADICVQYPKQKTWYAAFANAALVITNSFHGTIFAIKNRVPFVNTLMADKETKISNLLNQMDLRFNDRLMSCNKSIYECVKKIDYTIIEQKIAKEKKKSEEYLRKGINECYQG